MYERMLDKANEPTIKEIATYIGKNSNGLLNKLDIALNERYDLIRELRFPYGKDYGWSYKYAHKSKHLCDLFFEKGAITMQIQIGGDSAEKLDDSIDVFLPITKKLWEEKYPCGKGGWIIYRIEDNKMLEDALKIIAIKKKPKQ